MFEITITIDGKSEKYSTDKLPVTISHLPTFAIVVKEAAQQSVQPDGATCSAKYHLLLAEKGDTVCGVCGAPLRR